MHLGWTNLSEAVKSCSTIKGTMFKIVLTVTLSLHIAYFIYYNLAFDLLVL